MKLLGSPTYTSCNNTVDIGLYHISESRALVDEMVQLECN